MTEDGARPVEEWDGDRVRVALAGPEPPIIVDVRTEGEFAQGSLPGARNIPLDELDRRVSEIPEGGGPVVVVCSDGERSSVAVMILRSHGIGDAVILKGGLSSVGIETDSDVD